MSHNSFFVTLVFFFHFIVHRLHLLFAELVGDRKKQKWTCHDSIYEMFYLFLFISGLRSMYFNVGYAIESSANDI